MTERLEEKQVVELISQKVQSLTKILGASSPPELIELFFEWGGIDSKEIVASSFLTKSQNKRIALLKKTCKRMKVLRNTISRPFNALANDVLDEAEWLLTEMLGPRNNGE